MPAEPKPFDFNNIGTSVNSPVTLAHVVLNARDIEKSRDFWIKFLGGRVQYEKPGVASFLTYDEEHHRIALISRPHHKPKDSTLVHIAFTYPTLQELLLAYRQRLQLHGFKPVLCVNHGPTMSLYYDDVDGNQVETQYDVFSTAEEANDFMMTPEFDENPVGVDFDPEDLIRRLEAGEDVKTLCVRPKIGPRSIASVTAK